MNGISMTGPSPKILDDTRAQALRALMAFERKRQSMKSILRDFETASDSRDEQHGLLALGVMRYMNTLDYLLVRGLDRRNIRDLDSDHRNLGRLALFETRWLNRNIGEIHELYPTMPTFLLRAVERASELNLSSFTSKLKPLSKYSVQYSHPGFLVGALLDNLPNSEAKQLLESNNRNRSYYIRVNQLDAGRDGVLTSLEERGVGFANLPDIPGLHVITEGIEHLVTSPEFTRGSVLIQDKSSVLAVRALNVQSGDRVWDTCAAPGMKTQLISEQLEGNGRIIATDFYQTRVKRARNLSKKFGIENVEWVQSDATRPTVISANKILIDAPCTSTGILQSYPSFKWRLNKEVLFALMTVQNKILDGVLSAYENNPGTEIVYATCSLLPHEGESQIESALSRHNIELLEPVLPDSPGYKRFECSDMVTRLFPHRHNANGFFIARLRIVH